MKKRMTFLTIIWIVFLIIPNVFAGKNVQAKVDKKLCAQYDKVWSRMLLDG